jgi:hypothetical protein
MGDLQVRILRIVTVMSPRESLMSHVKSINVCYLSVRQPCVVALYMPTIEDNATNQRRLTAKIRLR